MDIDSRHTSDTLGAKKKMMEVIHPTPLITYAGVMVILVSGFTSVYMFLFIRIALLTRN